MLLDNSMPLKVSLTEGESSGEQSERTDAKEIQTGRIHNRVSSISSVVMGPSTKTSWEPKVITYDQ